MMASQRALLSRGLFSAFGLHRRRFFYEDGLLLPSAVEPVGGDGSDRIGQINRAGCGDIRRQDGLPIDQVGRFFDHKRAGCLGGEAKVELAVADLVFGELGLGGRSASGCDREVSDASQFGDGRDFRGSVEVGIDQPRKRQAALVDFVGAKDPRRNGDAGGAARVGR